MDFEFTEDLSLRRDFLNKNGMDVYCLYVLYGLEVLIANKFNQKFVFTIARRERWPLLNGIRQQGKYLLINN